MKLKEKLDNLVNQKQQLEVTLIKVQGAIELIEAMMAEKEEKKEEKEKK